jgi:hypothetical protein
MDRRVTLQKHREVSDVCMPVSGGCVSPPEASPGFTTGSSSALFGSSGTSVIECDTETITIPLETVENSIHNVNVVNNRESTPVIDNQNTVSPRSSWEVAKRRRRGDPENISFTSGNGGRRKRLTSWTSSVNSDVVSHEGRNSVTKETTGEHKRMQKKLRTKGFCFLFSVLNFKYVNDVNVDLNSVNDIAHMSKINMSFVCVCVCVCVCMGREVFSSLFSE